MLHHTATTNDGQGNDDDDDLEVQSDHENNNTRLSAAMTSFLHTIPENAGSDGPPTSVFNPALVEESLGAGGGGVTSPTAASLGLEDDDGDGHGVEQSWSAMMRPFRASQNRVPPAPGSVASSTRAVEAGNPGTTGISNLGISGGGGGGSSSGMMDGSITAVAGGGGARSDLETAAGGIGDADSTLEQAAGRGAAHLASTTATTAPAGVPGGRPTPATTGRKKATRRPSALARADKRKVGMVCLAALVVVIVVVISLIVIVAKLDHNKEDSATTDLGNSSAVVVDGNMTETGNNTADPGVEFLPTLAPTAAESAYSFAAAAAGGTTTQGSTGGGASMSSFAGNPEAADAADAYVDDDDDNMAGGSSNSILEVLDEAILRLYTDDEETKWNMLPHVSGEVFSHGLSPRYKAREWLLNTDTLLQTTLMNVASEMDISSEETLDRIAQRYIMLVFYFSTMEPQNIMDYDQMDTMVEEDHDPGENRRLQQSATTTSTTSTTPSQFQIYPDVHECFWIANACGQDGASATAQQQQQGGADTQSIAVAEVFAVSKLSTEYIKYITLPDANLQGTLPFELGYLSGLQELRLASNQLTGSIPELLVTHPQFLYVLDLSLNSLSSTIPPSLWYALPSLRFAYLHGNQLTGTIPSTRFMSSTPQTPEDAATTPTATTVSATATATAPTTSTTSHTSTATATTPSNLEEIWLRDNNLSGNIPQWWATDLPNLDVLSVRNNSWTGSLPLDWTTPQKLKYMDVSHNELSGNIPPSLLYGIPALQYLYLDDNQFVGTLPTSTELLASGAVTVSRENNKDQDCLMQALWLQYNQLTGTIPKGFGWEWQHLKTLELHGNQLTGQWECMDPEENDAGNDLWPQLEELAVDCAADTAEVSGVDVSSCEACCIKCY